MTLEGLFDKIKQIMEGGHSEEEDKKVPSPAITPTGNPADTNTEELDLRRYAHVDGDREDTAPSSQEPDGDVEEGALPGCLEPVSGSAEPGRDIRRAGNDAD